MFWLYSLLQTVQIRCKSLSSAIIIIIIIIIIKCTSCLEAENDHAEKRPLRKKTTKWVSIDELTDSSELSVFSFFSPVMYAADQCRMTRDNIG